MGLLTSLCLVLTTVFCGCLYVVHRLLTPTVSTKGTTNIPGPTEGRRWPIVGHALCFLGVNSMKDLYEALKRLGNMRDKLMSFYMGPQLVIIVMDANILEAIIRIGSKCLNKDEDFYHSINSVTNGVLSKNGKEWSDMRRPLDRFLHPKNMDNFHRITVDKAKTLCIKVGNQCGQGRFDMKNLMDYFTLDITLETLLNVPGTQQVEDTLHFPKLAAMLTDIVFTRLVKIEYKNDWTFSLSSLARTVSKCKDELRPHLKEMVNNCLKRLDISGRNPSDPNFTPENYIEVAIQIGIREKKTEEETIFSFFDLIVAGFDTTSVATSSALLFLAMHPQYQERAYEEQIEVMKGSLGAPTREELSRMNYLDRAFNETLRHVSPPAIVRTISSEFTIDGYIFPEGASLLISYHNLHHDPSYWDRPKDFYPDHFLSENVAARPKGAFLPFSFGGRACPGKLLSSQSAKLIISMLLRRFKFTTSLKFEEMDYKYMLMLESDKGYPLEIITRPSLNIVL